MTNERYFYTTSYPHKWTSGPLHHYHDEDGVNFYIPTLERAKELAEKYNAGRPGHEEYCHTTYGVEYID